jgi:hypothetical protein
VELPKNMLTQRSVTHRPGRLGLKIASFNFISKQAKDNQLTLRDEEQLVSKQSSKG